MAQLALFREKLEIGEKTGLFKVIPESNFSSSAPSVTASVLQLKAAGATQPLIFQPCQLLGETTCWEIPQPRHSALTSPVQSWQRWDGSGVGTRGERSREPGAADESCAWQCPGSCARASARSRKIGNSTLSGAPGFKDGPKLSSIL